MLLSRLRKKRRQRSLKVRPLGFRLLDAFAGRVLNRKSLKLSIRWPQKYYKGNHACKKKKNGGKNPVKTIDVLEQRMFCVSYQ